MRRALLVGINYTGTSNQLYGCINDINNVGSYLYTFRKYNSFIVNPQRYGVDLQIDDEFFAKIKNY